jgi:hypothetical protein
VTLDELLAQLEREAAIGMTGVSEPASLYQLPIDEISRRVEAMRAHPSRS